VAAAQSAPVTLKTTTPTPTPTAAAPAPADSAPAASDEKKSIRTVGPTFIPPKQ